MSKTLLCHISTPAALKRVSMIYLKKPQNMLLFCGLVFFSQQHGCSFRKISEGGPRGVIKGVKSAEDFVPEVAITHLN